MRSSFVSTGSPSPCTDGISSLRAIMCSLLPSSGITHLHSYYEAIRLPAPHLPSSLFGCPAYSRSFERDTGPPGLPCNRNVRHAMVSDPEKARSPLSITVNPVLTSTPSKVSSFLSRHLRGSIPSVPPTAGLMACLLAVLRLKPYVTIEPPKTRCPVVDHPSGAGFPPARLHDLARPH
jgi:hypothetical protein